MTSPLSLDDLERQLQTAMIARIQITYGRREADRDNASRLRILRQQWRRTDAQIYIHPCRFGHMHRHPDLARDCQEA